MTRQPLFLAFLTSSLLVTACTGGQRKADSPGAVAVRGPILGILVASSLSDQGKPIDARFSFLPDQPQVTVIVQVGKIHGSPLDVTWYRLAGGKQELLFRHRVDVSTYDLAYSIGRNPGELAEGTYLVSATLEGRSEAVEWQIIPGESSTSPDDSSARGPQPQSGQAPVSGKSGAIAPASDDVGEPPNGWVKFCLGGGELQGCGDAIDETSDHVEVAFRFEPPRQPMNASPQPATVYLFFGSGQGDGAIVAKVKVSGAGEAWFRLDPCSLAVGHNDLPGTRFNVGAVVSEGNPGGSDRIVITLGPDTSAPRVRLTSTPLAGSRVKAGDEIELTASAEEEQGGYASTSWQTGIQSIKLTAPEGPLGNPVVFGSAPAPCEGKSTPKAIGTTYRVPGHAPAVVRICATAADFSRNEGSGCADFYTGDVWVGSMQTQTSAEYFKGVAVLHSIHTAVYESTLELVVGADRQISGHGTARLVSGVCSASGPTTREINFDISGVAHADQLEMYLTFVGSTPPKSESCGFGVGFMEPTVHQPLFVPITGSGRASGNATDGWDPNDTTHFEGMHVVELVCQGCPGGGG